MKGKHKVLILVLSPILAVSILLYLKSRTSQFAEQQLLATIETGSPRAKEQAASLLWGNTNLGTDHIPRLIRLLDDPSPGVKVTALAALQRFGTQSAPALPKLRTLLKDTNRTVRINALAAVGNIGNFPRETMDDLISIAKNAPKDEAVWAVFALGSIGPSASNALPVLRELTGSPHLSIKSAAQDSLKRIDPNNLTPGPAAIPLVREMLRDSSRDKRLAGLDKILLMSPPPLELSDEVHKLSVEDSDETVRKWARAAEALISQYRNHLEESRKRTAKR